MKKREQKGQDTHALQNVETLELPPVWNGFKI